MPRTRIQRIVDSSKDNPLGLNAESPLSREKAFDSATIQRFRKLPNSSLLVDLDTGIVYVDPQTLKVLQ